MHIKDIRYMYHFDIVLLMLLTQVESLCSERAVLLFYTHFEKNMWEFLLQ